MEILKMNTFETNVIRGLLLTVLIGLLMACGGGSGGSASTSEPVVARGVITDLGSIWVNGVEYETPDGGSYSNDDSTSSTASYEVGQVVSLRGRRNDDGVSGTADVVEYEAEVEGSALGGKINGVTIVITSTTNVSLATLDVTRALQDGFRYEVSGFRLDDRTIEATFIKDEDIDDRVGDEVKGPVEDVATNSLTVFGIIYNYSGVPAVAVGDFVEIHFDPSSFTTPPDTYTATEVELEDDFFNGLGDGQEVEVEGPVNIMDSAALAAACPNGGDFMIDTTCIDWNTNTEWSDGLDSDADLLSGIRVEAEGHVNAADVLVAEEIKGRGNRVRALSIPTVTGAGTFDLFGGAIQVTTSSATELEGISLSTLLTGGVEVRGIRTGPTSMLATRIDAEDAPVDKNELRAEVDLNGVDSTVSLESITLMGLTVSVNGSTQLEIEDVPYTSTLTSFLDMIDDNDSVADGSRDIIDLRFDIGALIADQVEIEMEDD
jgi:hypothetical protein